MLAELLRLSSVAICKGNQFVISLLRKKRIRKRMIWPCVCVVKTNTMLCPKSTTSYNWLAQNANSNYSLAFVKKLMISVPELISNVTQCPTSTWDYQRYHLFPTTLVDKKMQILVLKKYFSQTICTIFFPFIYLFFIFLLVFRQHLLLYQWNSVIILKTMHFSFCCLQIQSM